MIRIFLRGRAGNQLFQYAAGRALAHRHGVSLGLDISGYGPGSRRCILRRLPIAAKTLNPLPAWLCRGVTGQWPWHYSRQPVYREAGHRFDPAFRDLPAACTLFGWFQSEKYFQPIAELIHQEFSLDGLPLDPATREMERRIGDADAVALHIRRADYLGQPFYEVCTPRYYQNAMRHVGERVADPHFFIFSDDPDWCREHFRGPTFTLVDLPASQQDPLNDLRLMTLCRHNIIANSSYSWWGAWLNRNPERVVVAPKIWFNRADAVLADKLCAGWASVPI